MYKGNVYRIAREVMQMTPEEVAQELGCRLFAITNVEAGARRQCNYVKDENGEWKNEYFYEEISNNRWGKNVRERYRKLIQNHLKTNPKAQEALLIIAKDCLHLEPEEYEFLK